MTQPLREDDDRRTVTRDIEPPPDAGEPTEVDGAEPIDTVTVPPLTVPEDTKGG